MAPLRMGFPITIDHIWSSVAVMLCGFDRRCLLHTTSVFGRFVLAILFGVGFKRGLASFGESLLQLCAILPSLLVRTIASFSLVARPTTQQQTSPA